MKLIIDKMPATANDCMFARKYYRGSIGINGMCILEKSEGIPCVLIQKGNPECPHLIERKTE